MRIITAAFRDAIESSNSSEVVMIFATITHPTLVTPICVNSDIKDYVLGANKFLGTAMSVSLLSDQINAPSAKISIPNVDRRIGNAVLGLRTSPVIKLEVYARSDWDTSDPRVPNGTPIAEYTAPFLFLRNVTCDALGFIADINSYDLSSEPYPSQRTTKNRTPALFR